jgi:hypothetical protein
MSAPTWRSGDQLELDVGIENNREWWRHDGAIVAAMSEGGGQTVHAGRVNWLGGCYSMSPLCRAYRKADGTELARYARGNYPMLVRNLSAPFDEYVRGVRRTHRPLCRHCVIVFERSAS